MDKKLEQIVSLAGNKNKYQYFALIIMFLLWVNSSFPFTSFPLLTQQPKISYKNKNSIIEEYLNNEICNYKNINYTVGEEFDYSWITSFNFECNDTKYRLFMIFIIIGNFLGPLLFSVITRFITYKKILILSSFFYISLLFGNTFISSSDSSYSLFILFSFIEIFSICILYIALFLLVEIIDSDLRSHFLSLLIIGYQISGIFFAFFFPLINNWKIVFYIPVIASFVLFLVSFLFIYESPREVIYKKSNVNFIIILERISKFNGKYDSYIKEIKNEENQHYLQDIVGEGSVKEEKISIDISLNERTFNEKTINQNTVVVNEGGQDNTLAGFSETNMLSSIYDPRDPLLLGLSGSLGNSNLRKLSGFSAFSFRFIRKRIITLCAFWFGDKYIYNYINQTIKIFPDDDDFQLNLIIIGVINAISILISGVLINNIKLGRKNMLRIQYLLIMILFLLKKIINHDNLIIQSILDGALTFSMNGINFICIMYTIEVFPTVFRSFIFGMCGIFGSIGFSVEKIIEITIENNKSLVIVPFIFCIINFILIFFLEEMGKRPLEENLY